MRVRDLLIHNSGAAAKAPAISCCGRSRTSSLGSDIIAGLQHLKPVQSFRSHYAYDNLLYIRRR
jgi:hypothetical protein